MIQVTFVTKDKKTYERVQLGTVTMPELPSRDEYLVLDGARYLVSHREWDVKSLEQHGDRRENVAAIVHLLPAIE
jgi:hypothetical protein